MNETGGRPSSIDNGAQIDRPVVVEVRDLDKRFRMPGHRPDTLKGRVVGGFTTTGLRELKVLDGISFEIRRGEFFGVVGRNGSGKSTLLKMLANIYKADRGTIRVAGRVAPIIELGVGFQPELAARENVILNGMMMGLTEREAARRFDAVVDFAELRDFVDVKLKNYSSGMQVRLAFATMLEADPDVFLLDEVLAVGDPPFRRKCEDAFRRLKADGGKTIIIVTHQMPTVEAFCDRAMLLEGGRVARMGRPDEVAKAYEGLLARPGSVPKDMAHEGEGEDHASLDQKASIVGLGLIGDRGGTEAFEPGEGIRVRMTVEASQEIRRPAVQLQIRNQSQLVTVFFPPVTEIAQSLSTDEQVTIDAEIENKLAPGSYWLFCALIEMGAGQPMAVSDVSNAEFSVRQNGGFAYGLVTLEHEIHAATPGENAHELGA
jgi:ABC-type polysaccharide/polyol phosphate transport system ATPase subunit